MHYSHHIYFVTLSVITHSFHPRFQNSDYKYVQCVTNFFLLMLYVHLHPCISFSHPFPFPLTLKHTGFSHTACLQMSAFKCFICNTCPLTSSYPACTASSLSVLTARWHVMPQRPSLWHHILFWKKAARLGWIRYSKKVKRLIFVTYSGIPKLSVTFISLKLLIWFWALIILETVQQ